MGQNFSSVEHSDVKKSSVQSKRDKSDKPIIVYSKIACGLRHTIFISDNQVYACGEGHGKILEKIDFPHDIKIEHIVCRELKNIIVSSNKIYTWKNRLSTLDTGESITEIVLPDNQMITSITCGS